MQPADYSLFIYFCFLCIHPVLNVEAFGLIPSNLSRICLPNNSETFAHWAFDVQTQYMIWCICNIFNGMYCVKISFYLKKKTNKKPQNNAINQLYDLNSSALLASLSNVSLFILKSE